MFAQIFVCFDAPLCESFEENDKEKCEQGKQLFAKGGVRGIVFKERNLA